MNHYSLPLIASLLAATLVSAQQAPMRPNPSEDSVLVAAVIHVIPRLPAGNIAVSPEYRILFGEPGNGGLISVAHSRGFLAGIIGDETHTVTFLRGSEIRADADKCGVKERLSPVAALRANGVCQLRGVTASVATGSFKIVDGIGRVFLSIEQNNGRGTSSAHSLEVTVERRGARWVVTGERVLVEQ